MKLLAKLNKIELSGEFMAMWREEETLFDLMPPLYQDKNEKDKSLKRISDKFQIFSDRYFQTKFCFSLPQRSLNFSYVFKLALKLHSLVDKALLQLSM